jgi:hypothetical protein
MQMKKPAKKKYNSGGDVPDSRIKSATILSRAHRKGMEENGLADEYLTAKKAPAGAMKAAPKAPQAKAPTMSAERKAKMDAKAKELFKRHQAPLK